MKILRILRRGIFVVGIPLVLLAAVYAGGSAIYLNSSSFIRVLGMEDTTQTHVRPHAAWSPFPGLFRAREVLVAIRDQNVVIDIRLHGVKFRFRPRSLFKKHLDITALTAERTAVTVHLRNERERQNYYATHPDPTRGKIPSDEKIAEMRDRRWLISIPHLLLKEVSPILLGRKPVQGRIQIQGGFELRPGVEAEIYPTRVGFRNAAYDRSLSHLDGDAVAQFHRWSAPKTPGSKVYRYFDAEAHLVGRTEDFDFVNLTLRSLDGFGLANGRTKFKADLFARSGVLQPGSLFETPDEEFELRNSSFQFRGTGRIRWWIPNRDGTSRFGLFTRRAEAKADFGSLYLRGKAYRIEAGATIEGTDLQNPFTALRGRLRVTDGSYSIDAVTGFPWNARGSIDGALSGFTGGLETADRIPEKQRLAITIDHARLALPLRSESGKPLPILARGRAVLAGPAIQLTRRISLPDARFDLDFGRKSVPPSRLQVRLKNFHRSTDDVGRDIWSGNGAFRATRIAPILDELRDRGILSGLLRSAVAANRIESGFRWQMRPDYSVIRADSVRSDGSWSADGAYAKDSNGAWLALVRGKYLGIPITAAASPIGTSWKLLQAGPDERPPLEEEEKFIESLKTSGPTQRP